MEKRSLFFISDGTGITAETLGHSLLSQFQNLEWDSTALPYVDDLAKAENAAHLIQQAYEKDGKKPLVFATLVNKDIHAYLSKTPCVLFDFLRPLFIDWKKNYKCPLILRWDAVMACKIPMFITQGLPRLIIP